MRGTVPDTGGTVPLCTRGSNLDGSTRKDGGSDSFAVGLSLGHQLPQYMIQCERANLAWSLSSAKLKRYEIYRERSY